MFLLKDTNLVYIVDSLTLNPWPKALMTKQSLSNTSIFSVRHITAFCHLRTLDSTLELHMGGVLSTELPTKKQKRRKHDTMQSTERTLIYSMS